MNNNLFRNNICEYAKEFVGKKYKEGKSGPLEFDTAGFVYYVYKMLFNIDISNNGMGLDGTTRLMSSDVGILKHIANEKDKLKFLESINIGDLLFFHTKSLNDNTCKRDNWYPGHVAIYLGGNEFIHACFYKGEIIIQEFNQVAISKLVACKDIVSDILKKEVK